MQPANEDEYLGIGIISRLANGRLSRGIGLVTVVAMGIPVIYFIARLY